MPLATTHTNWMSGSYASDVLLLLKIAENNPLRLNPAQVDIEPEIDSVGSLFIGYGYDLLQNRVNAVTQLTAAGATITDPVLFRNELFNLSAPVSMADRMKIAALLMLPTEQVAETLLQNTITNREATFTGFLAQHNMER